VKRPARGAGRGGRSEETLLISNTSATASGPSRGGSSQRRGSRRPAPDPAFLLLTDPDGNQSPVDQHASRPGKEPASSPTGWRVA